MLLWFAQSLRNGSSTASTLSAIVLLGVWALYAHWLAAQRVSEASLTIQQSSVRVRGEKVSRTLRPKDIRSSTTALHRDGGYDVALELRGTRDPIVLQGLNDEEFPRHQGVARSFTEWRRDASLAERQASCRGLVGFCDRSLGSFLVGRRRQHRTTGPRPCVAAVDSRRLQPLPR